jgi:hypothetical protein
VFRVCVALNRVGNDDSNPKLERPNDSIYKWLGFLFTSVLGGKLNCSYMAGLGDARQCCCLVKVLDVQEFLFV